MSTQIRPNALSTSSTPPLAEIENQQKPVRVRTGEHVVTLPDVPSAPVQPRTEAFPSFAASHHVSTEKENANIESGHVQNATPKHETTIVPINVFAVEEENEEGVLLRNVDSVSSNEISSEKIPTAVAVAVPVRAKGIAENEEPNLTTPPAVNPDFQEARVIASSPSAGDVISAPRTPSGDLRAAEETRLQNTIEEWKGKYSAAYATAKTLVESNSKNTDAIEYYKAAGKLFKAAAEALSYAKDQVSMNIAHCLYHEAECKLQMGKFAEQAPKPALGLEASVKIKPFDQRDIFERYQKVAEGFELAGQDLSINVPARQSLIDILKKYKNVLDKNAAMFNQDSNVSLISPYCPEFENHFENLRNAMNRFQIEIKDSKKKAASKDSSCVVM